MPALARLGDLSTGHHCFPPQKLITASPNVFINGIPVARVDDIWSPHCCGKTCHTGNIVETSLKGSVIINGSPAATVGMKSSCGSVVMTGSPNVYCEIQ